MYVCGFSRKMKQARGFIFLDIFLKIAFKIFFTAEFSMEAELTCRIVSLNVN